MHISIKKENIVFHTLLVIINTVEVNPWFGLIKEFVSLSYVEIESEHLLFQPLSQFRLLNT